MCLKGGGFFKVGESIQVEGSYEGMKKVDIQVFVLILSLINVVFLKEMLSLRVIKNCL